MFILNILENKLKIIKLIINMYIYLNNIKQYNPLNTRKYSYNLVKCKLLSNKSLVNWGTNLSSTVGMKISKNELNNIKLPNYIKNVIIGILLSDGYIVFSAKSKNGSLGLTQSLSHSNYIYFVFNILAHYCARYPIFRERFRYGKLRFSLEIYTRSMPCITELYKDFYINKKKVIKPSIYNELAPVTLAH